MSRPRLDVLSGDLTGRSYVVDEDEFVIGRGRNCDLVIPKRYISREHARIVRSRNAFVIGGLSEKNPIVVGDRAIREHPLKDGDVFEMCGIQFRFSIPKGGKGGKAGKEANHTSTVESGSGVGWRDEDTEGGFGEGARERQRRQTKGAADSWADVPVPAPSKDKPKAKRRKDVSDEDEGWQDDDQADWQKDDGWASESAPKVEEGGDSGWRSESAPRKEPDEGWEAEPRGKLADSWSDEEPAPARKPKRKTAARQAEEESWDDEDSWSEDAKQGERKSGIVFEVDDQADPNEATGAMSAKKLSHLSSRGSGAGEIESDAERTAELNKQLDPDDPDYDPFAQIDNEGPKVRVVDPNREKLLRVLGLVGLVGVFLAYLMYAEITGPKPPLQSTHSPPAQTYVGGSTLMEITWQAGDRPQIPSQIDTSNISGEPDDERLLIFDGVAKVEWVLPRLERSLFLIQGIGEGTATFRIFYPVSNRLVTYSVEVSGEDPHAIARDKRRLDFRNQKSPRDLAQRMKESFAGAERFTQGQTLPLKEGYYRKAYLKYGESLDAAEALAAAEARRGGKTQATSDWVKKCREAEVRAQERWEERLSRDLARYRNLVADGSAGLSDRREQLRSVLRLIGHTCDVRFRRLETFLREEYGGSLQERETCPHDEQ